MFSFMGSGTDLFGPFPVLEGYAESNGGDANVASLSATAPPGIVAGESLMIFAYALRGGGVSFGGVVPSGWSFEGFTPVSSSMAIGVFYKEVATGAEGAITITPDTSCRMLCTYMRISSAGQVTFIDVSDYNEQGSPSVDSTVPEVTTTVNNCLAFFGAVHTLGSAVSVTVTGNGWTKLDQDNTGLTTSNITAVFGSKLVETAGLTDDVDIEWDGSSNVSSYFQLAIRPR